jgi:hypothetical protein
MLRFALLLSLFAGCDRGPKSEAATTSSPSTAPAVSADVKTQKFGAGVSVAEVTSISKILATPDAFKGKTVKVEGMVTDVCPKRGCWFEMAGENAGEKLKFKVVDGEMVFPVDSKGMYAQAQGQVTVKELSLEESKQYAEYQAKEYGKPYDPASVTKPTLIVRLDGTGAVFRDKK